MRIVFAIHDGCAKEYVFEVPDGMRIKCGDILLVDTARGPQPATATSVPIQCDPASEVATRFGAFFPLKKVLQVCGKELREYIRRKTEAELIDDLRARHAAESTSNFDLTY